MGDWKFSEFTNYLKFQLGQRTDLEAATDNAEDLYGVWINLGYRELTTARKILGKEYYFRFPQTEISGTKTTTDGENYVAVPTGCIYIEDIYDETNNRWLEPIPHREFIQYTDRSDTNAENKPTEWVRHGSDAGVDNVYLHPTPDTTGETLRIYHKKLVTYLTGSGVTVISAEWDEIILQLALLKGLRWTKEYETLSVEAKTLGALLDQQVGLYKKEELGRDQFMRPSITYLRRGEQYKK